MFCMVCVCVGSPWSPDSRLETKESYVRVSIVSTKVFSAHGIAAALSPSPPQVCAAACARSLFCRPVLPPFRRRRRSHRRSLHPKPQERNARARSRRHGAATRRCMRQDGTRRRDATFFHAARATIPPPEEHARSRLLVVACAPGAWSVSACSEKRANSPL